ncbi:PHB depolymerase family esterase [Duganella ginsengisoli]|uniref:PHB depolymerase family esterase n=2 Tax=Pseudoduganella ginsengisoli TaxID=1462440 RepID=A0A6L6PZ87_9BURK|nr:PHB depolymerase family esterase [Pseudoduganella ginsengisoli]
MANGPVAATAAIQQALGGQPAPAQQQPAMRDLNPAPAASRTSRPPANPADTLHIHTLAGDVHDEPESPAAATQAPQRASVHMAPGAKALVDGLLAKLGALQSDGTAAMPDLPDLSGLSDLPGLDLPGQRKVRTPAPLPPGAQFVAGVYRGATGTRDYKLYVPANYHGQPMPLLVMLHGCTQDPDDFAAGTRMNALAEEQGLLVVYPAQSRQANQQRCWNWFNALDQQRGQGEPAIIAGIAQQVAAQYAVAPRQVYVAGMSAGGAMAVIAGTLYPDIFAAVGVHSGLPYASARDLPSALQAMKQGAPAKDAAIAGNSRPIIVFHGDRDHTVHPRNGEQVMSQQLHRHAGARAQRDQGSVPQGRNFTRTTHHHPDGTPLGEHWVIHGAGHAWSGGSTDGSYTDASGPDASREMLRFFHTVAA